MSQNESQKKALEIFQQVMEQEPTKDCFHEDVLWDYVTGDIHDPEKARMELHMKDCQRCLYHILNNKAAIGQWEGHAQELDRIEMGLQQSPTTFRVPYAQQ